MDGASFFPTAEAVSSSAALRFRGGGIVLGVSYWGVGWMDVVMIDIDEANCEV